MAIPRADTGSYERLRQRTTTALDLLRELEGVEFKKSASWEDLKRGIIKTCLAMANSQDGGIIVIGVDESGDSWKRTGIEKQDLDTFDPDDCLDQIGRYASPAVHPAIVSVSYGEREYLVFDIPEYEDLPVVCSKSHGDWKFRRGAVYHRPRGKPESVEIASEVDMRKILQRASEKAGRRIVQQGLAVGLLPPSPPQQIDSSMYEKERGDL